MWRRRPLVPGHRVAHAVFWTFCPSQKAPPLRGAGLVQLRLRFCQPRPQVALQTDHSVHVDHPPFTGRTEKDWVRERGLPQTCWPRGQGGRDLGLRLCRRGALVERLCSAQSPRSWAAPTQRPVPPVGIWGGQSNCSSWEPWLRPQLFTPVTPTVPSLSALRGTRDPASHLGLSFLGSFCPLISLCPQVSQGTI